MDIETLDHVARDPAALPRYRKIVSRLADRSSVTDDEFDLLAPVSGAAADGAIWVAVMVSSQVVPRV